MHRLVFLDSAKDDLAEIAAYLRRESQSRKVADDFIERLIQQCETIAATAGHRGRARPELRPAYRSVTFGNYVIFLRYVAEGSESVLEVIHVLNGRRDFDAFFVRQPDDSEG